MHPKSCQSGRHLRGRLAKGVTPIDPACKPYGQTGRGPSTPQKGYQFALTVRYQTDDRLIRRILLA